MTDFLDSARSQTLQQMAYGESADDILASLCTEFEGQVPDTIAGVTILDRSSRIFEDAIFPSLSRAYSNALHGIAVEDKPGSCALAVYEGRTVVCDDVESDPRFSDGWKQLGLAHGLQALISIPAMHRDGMALGTFVVGYATGKRLSEREQELADSFAELAGLVLTYRRNQSKQELLVGELQHRVRNLFSTIGAVVYSTLKVHPKPENFRKAFDGRLQALAKAHALAIDSHETDLRALLVDILAPFSIDHRVKLEGPKVLLSQEAAVAFSLAAHELATNAAKYGAFSKDGGSVAIGWDFKDDSEGNSDFIFDWTERGGPTVAEPKRQGYGQKTLHRSISSAIDGKVELDYDPAGLRCRIDAPNSPRLGARAH